MSGTSLWRVLVAVCGFALLAGACGTVAAGGPGGVSPATGGSVAPTLHDNTAQSLAVSEQLQALSEQTRQQNRTPENGEPPLADAGLDREVLQNESVPLDAGDSRAPAGEIVAYEWEITPPANTTARPACRECRDTRFVPRKPGTYAVTVTVTDSNGRQSSDTLYVSVGERDPPEASLRGPETLAVGESGRIDLSAQPQTHPLRSVTWRVDGELRASLFTSEEGFWSQQVRFDRPGRYTVTAAVRDRTGLSTLASHTLRVVPVQRIETTVDTDQIGTRSGLLVNETKGYPVTTTAYTGTGTGQNVTSATSYTLTNGSSVATIETRSGLPVLVPTSYPTGGQQVVTVEAVYNSPGNRTFRTTTDELLFDPVQNLSVTVETDTVDGTEVLLTNRSGYRVATTATYVGGAGTDTVTTRATHAIVAPDGDVAGLGANPGRASPDARATSDNSDVAGVTLDPQRPTAPGDPLELRASYPLAGVEYAHTAVESVPIVGLAAHSLSVDIAADRIGLNETTTATTTLDIGYVHEEREGLVETRTLGAVVPGPLDDVLSTNNAIVAQTNTSRAVGAEERADGAIRLTGVDYGTGRLNLSVGPADTPLTDTVLTGSDTVAVGLTSYNKSPTITGVPGNATTPSPQVFGTAGSYTLPLARTTPAQLYVVYPYDPTAFDSVAEFQQAMTPQFEQSEYEAFSNLSSGQASTQLTTANNDTAGDAQTHSWYRNSTFTSVVSDVHNLDVDQQAVSKTYNENVSKGYPLRITGQNSTVDVAENLYYSPLSPDRITVLRDAEFEITGHDISHGTPRERGTVPSPEVDVTVENVGTEPARATVGLTLDGDVKQSKPTGVLAPGESTTVTVEKNQVGVQSSKILGAQVGIHTDSGGLVRVDDRASTLVRTDAALSVSALSVRNVSTDAKLINNVTNGNSWYYTRKLINVTYTLTNDGTETESGSVTAKVPDIQTTSVGFGAPNRDTEQKQYELAPGEQTTQTITFNVSRNNIGSGGLNSILSFIKFIQPYPDGEGPYMFSHKLTLSVDNSQYTGGTGTFKTPRGQVPSDTSGSSESFEITNMETEYNGLNPDANDYTGKLKAEVTVQNTGETTNTTILGLVLDGQTPFINTRYNEIQLAPGESRTVTLNTGGEFGNEQVNFAPTTSVTVKTGADPPNVGDSIDTPETFGYIPYAHDTATETYIAESAVSTRSAQVENVDVTTDLEGDTPEITVEAALANRGDRDGTHTLTLRKDGTQVASDTLALAPGDEAQNSYEVQVNSTISGVSLELSFGQDSWKSHVAFDGANRTLLLTGESGLDFSTRDSLNDVTTKVLGTRGTQFTGPKNRADLTVTKTDGDPLGLADDVISGDYPLNAPAPRPLSVAFAYTTDGSGFGDLGEAVTNAPQFDIEDNEIESLGSSLEGAGILGTIAQYYRFMQGDYSKRDLLGGSKKLDQTITVEEGDPITMLVYSNWKALADYVQGKPSDCPDRSVDLPASHPCHGFTDSAYRPPYDALSFSNSPLYQDLSTPNQGDEGRWRGSITEISPGTLEFGTESWDIPEGETRTVTNPRVEVYEGIAIDETVVDAAQGFRTNAISPGEWTFEVIGQDDEGGGKPKK